MSVSAHRLCLTAVVLATSTVLAMPRAGAEEIDVYALFNQVAGDDSVFGALKDRELGGIKYSVGGQLRHRFHNEANRLRPGAPNAEYHLWRFTPYLKAQFTENIGGFVEAIDASIFQEGDVPFTSLGIDSNRLDFLRYYAEFNLLNEEDRSLKYRFGRQFLKYGSQRLLSPLGWANTFRNFEGHKFLYSSPNWDIDAFIVRSVNAAAGGSRFDNQGLDRLDQDRWTSGVYSTYKGNENSVTDLYWIYFNERNDSTAPRPAARIDGERHTIGLRNGGALPVKKRGKVVGTWTWDVEGAYQFGNDTYVTNVAADVSAGFATGVIGYTFHELPWSPGLKGFYYWSSGTSGDPTTPGNTNNTFFTLHPLGHAYWGLIDQFSGQNLQDVGATLTLKPHKQLGVTLTYHHFEKSASQDDIFNIAGAGFTSVGSDIGDEIDLVTTINVTKNFNVQIGYLWFFGGEAIAPITPTFAGDARLAYIQTTLKF